MTSQKPPAIYVKNACLSFKDSILFNNLNLSLRAARWTCLLGPSGVGKSSLLRLIANLGSNDTETRATVSANDGKPLADRIAYMAQTDLLLPWLTVLDNVLIGHHLRNQSGDKDKALHLLAEVGLRQASGLYPKDLSGGMRQRVALVRTLLQEKPVVLMDEPFSALDAITRFKLQNLAAKLLSGRSVFFVTHDPLESLRLADDIFIMSGKPATIQSTLTLHSATPRDPGSREVLKLQAEIYHELTKAHEVMA